MTDIIERRHAGWSIRIFRQQSMDESFSFEITDPKGNSKHVDTGGHTIEEAMERAKKMIEVQKTGAKYGVK